MADTSQEQQRRIGRHKAMKKQKTMVSGRRSFSYRQRVTEATTSRATLRSVNTTRSDRSIKPAIENLRQKQNIVTIVNKPLVPIPQPPRFDPNALYEDSPPVPCKDNQVPYVNPHASTSTKKLDKDQYNCTIHEAELSNDEENSEDDHAERNSSDSGNDPSTDEVEGGMEGKIWVSIAITPGTAIDAVLSNRPIQRPKNNAALRARHLASAASESEVGLAKAKAYSPVDPKKSIWERLTSSKRKAAKIRPTPRTKHTTKNEGLDELMEFVKETVRNNRTRMNLRDEFLDDNPANGNVNENGKVTDLSAPAILHKMCTEYRYPPPLSPEAHELVLTRIIFPSFRIYWKPKVFASMLRDFYRSSQQHQSAVIGLVETWLFDYWTPADRDDTHGAVLEITSFIGEMLNDGSFDEFSDRILKMLTRLHQYANGDRHHAIPPVQSNFRQSSLPLKVIDITRNLKMKYLDCKNVSLRQFFNKESTQDFAEQLTLCESNLMNAIKPIELVNSCIKPGADEDAEKRIVAQREFGKRLGRWAKWAVYRRSTPAKRADVVGFLCRLTLILLKLRNYESANTIYAAICDLSVSGDFMENLPLTRAALKAKTWDRKHELDRWFRDNRSTTLSMPDKTFEPTVPVLAGFVDRITKNAADRSMVSKSSVDGTTVLYNISVLEDAKRIVVDMEHILFSVYQLEQLGDFHEFLKLEFGRAPDTDEEVLKMYMELKAFELDAHDRKVAALEFD